VFNHLHTEYDLFSTPTVDEDVAMLARVHQIYCFYYGPPLWRFGKPCGEDGSVKWEEKDFDYIIDNCSNQTFDQRDLLYRVQLNVPETQLKDARFCSPPNDIRKFQRFDSKHLPILYAARDVETCLHESRVTLEDECFVAVLEPAKPMTFLDLSRCTAPDGVTPFEDPSIWLLALLYNGGEAYEVCRQLSSRIHARNFDGFIYNSYFQQAAERNHQNIAVFGRPLLTQQLMVRSLQKVRLSNVAYDWQFAPVVRAANIEDLSEYTT
jgi:hypothetical protein